MSKSDKKRVRAEFRRAVFARARYRCECCSAFGRDRQGGDEHTNFHSAGHSCVALVELDAHHITPREIMPGGGYVAENGISLCEVCHRNAEQALLEPAGQEGFGPARLYAIIGSSEDAARTASERLEA